MKLKATFDTNKIYMNMLTKEKLLEYIRKFKDKEFRVIFIPTGKTTCDVLITDKLGDKNGKA